MIAAFIPALGQQCQQSNKAHAEKLSAFDSPMPGMKEMMIPSLFI